jgi:hypothetical protein
MFEELTKYFALPFRWMFLFLAFLFKKKLLNRHEGAKLAKPSDYKERLNARNSGLLLDGESLKLAEKKRELSKCVRYGKGGSREDEPLHYPECTGASKKAVFSRRKRPKRRSLPSH